MNRPPDTYLLNTYWLNPIPTKNLIPLYLLNYPPDTRGGVCNTPLHKPNQHLLNTYLLNPIPAKNLIPHSTNPPITTHFWYTGVGAYGIRPTNAHDHGQTIRFPCTFWGVCNTPLPKPDTYLLNTYWLNPFPEKDLIHSLPLNPIPDKNLIPLYLLNHPPGTCRGVCNTPLPWRIKKLIPH